VRGWALGVGVGVGAGIGIEISRLFNYHQHVCHHSLAC